MLRKLILLERTPNVLATLKQASLVTATIKPQVPEHSPIHILGLFTVSSHLSSPHYQPAHPLLHFPPDFITRSISHTRLLLLFHFPSDYITKQISLHPTPHSPEKLH
jgi:hypothetical protein